MPPQSYNFFGLSPAQQQAPPDPSILALQAYNNPTSSQAQPSQGGGGMGGMNPQALAKMMMQQQGGTGVPADAQAQGIPADAMSYNTGQGPLPWQAQNALPWSGS